jgi:cytochrome P450
MTATASEEQILIVDERLIREALFNPNLSRTFDKATFAEGNIRERVVSVSHGNDHRQRRRLENSIFRRERLHQFERDLFPVVVDELLPMLIEGGRADLLEVGEILSVVLAARRAGIDHPRGDVAALKELVHYVLAFSQGSSILDTVGSTENVRDEVRQALADFDERYFTASYERRLALLAEGGDEDISAETDVLTLLLRHRDEPGLGLDRALILRETATYLQAGTHTSGQTLVNFFALFIPYAQAHEDAWERLCTDRFYAQRCVQETIRIRPTTPRIKRLAEDDTQVSDTPVPRGSVVVLDVYQANIDPSIWGPNAAEFDPEREVPEGHQPWGLSFGAGPHICIGRTVAAGLPTVSGNVEEHLTGLVTSEVQAAARLGIAMDPEREARRDDRTVRWTRWSTFPVVFGTRGSGG